MKTKAIVTGHSRGLGAGITRTFLSEQIPVLGLSRGLLESVPQLEQVQIDLADTQALLNWLMGCRLMDFVGDADRVLLINNAGLVGPVAPAKRQPELQVARSVALNVSAPLILTASIAKLPEHIQKRVVHVSSGAGRSAYPGWSVYCATKAALDHHARAVALESDSGLKLVSLAPGVVDTDMQSEIRRCNTDDFPNLERFHELKRSGQLVKPELTGQAIVNYVLSDQFGQEAIDDLRL